MRTYKDLSKIISDKLNRIEFKHDKVEAVNPRYRGHELEGGAACIVFTVHVGAGYFNMFGGQFFREIKKIVATKKYTIQLIQDSPRTLSDTWIYFINQKT